MLVMFIIGFVIFAVYLNALLRAIYWGHKSQRDEMTSMVKEINSLKQELFEIKSMLKKRDN